MQPRASTGRPGIVALARRWAAGLGGLVVALHAGAATSIPSGPGSNFVYTCKTGKTVIKADHPMADCGGRQNRTNPAGVEEWMLTPEQEEIVRRCLERREVLLNEWRSKDRSDKNLRAKYPDIASLRLGRDTDLAPARASVVRSQQRLDDLGKEHKRLALEREFYPKGPLPARLQSQIDDNDAFIAAQQQALKKAQEDVTRITANFDELETYMKRLWLAPSAPMPGVDCSPDALFGK